MRVVKGYERAFIAFEILRTFKVTCRVKTTSYA